eukprot:6409103-Lingulodinium_polyedra.AAC.1
MPDCPDQIFAGEPVSLVANVTADAQATRVEGVLAQVAPGLLGVFEDLRRTARGARAVVGRIWP